MKVYPFKHPAYTKVTNAKAGDFVQTYDEHLLPIGFFIIVKDNDSSISERKLLSVATGELIVVPASLRCVICKDAAIVRDFIEGA